MNPSEWLKQQFQIKPYHRLITPPQANTDKPVRPRAEVKLRYGGLLRRIKPMDYPALHLPERDWSTTEIKRLLGLLREWNPPAIENVLEGLRARIPAPELEAFGLRLFSLWQSHQSPPSEFWVPAALGFLGGDAAIEALYEYYRTSQGKSLFHTDAALNALAMNGSKLALLTLFAIWIETGSNAGTSTSYLALRRIVAREKARLQQAGADDAQFEWEDLGDRCIPDTDLSDRIFDYGARQFTSQLQPGMTLLVRDADGKRLNALPDADTDDDPAKVADAQRLWAQYQRIAAHTRIVQSHILEKALENRRFWTRDQFEESFWHHPLSRYVAQQLVWGVYTTAGEVQQTFRISEDLTLTDSHDMPSKLHAAAGDKIGLVRADQIPVEERQRWSGLLYDYGIVQPFAQISSRSQTEVTPDSDHNA